jgi:hypothetical protein
LIIPTPSRSLGNSRVASQLTVGVGEVRSPRLLSSPRNTLLDISHLTELSCRLRSDHPRLHKRGFFLGIRRRLHTAYAYWRRFTLCDRHFNLAKQRHDLHLARNRCRVAAPRRQGLRREAQSHPVLGHRRNRYPRDRVDGRRLLGSGQEARWSMSAILRSAARIRDLNNAFRRTLCGGRRP